MNNNSFSSFLKDYSNNNINKIDDEIEKNTIIQLKKMVEITTQSTFNVISGAYNVDKRLGKNIFSSIIVSILMSLNVKDEIPNFSDINAQIYTIFSKCKEQINILEKDFNKNG